MFANGCIRREEDGASARLAFLRSVETSGRRDSGVAEWLPARESDLIGTLAAVCVYIRRHLVRAERATGKSDTRARASASFVVRSVAATRHRQTGRVALWQWERAREASGWLGKQPSGHVIESRIMLSWD